MLLIKADNFEAERLKKRYKNFHNVKIYNQAIGDANGYKSLRILKNPTMSGFFKRTKNSPLFWGQRKYQEKLIAKKKVKFETLKNFLKKIKYKIDFIKMDVEGSELDILKHPGNLFSSLLALRSEVNFVDTFHDKQTKKKNYTVEILVI
jgi:FkbM family methyltransferase